MTSYVHAIWCDDIRMEVGNKPSFMGVYTGSLVIPALPTILPKLCVYVWIVEPIEKKISISAVRVLLGDDTVLAEISPQAPGDSEGIFGPTREGATRRVAMVALGIGGLELPEGAKFLSVVVDTADGKVVGPKLHIDVAATSDQLVDGQPNLS